MGPCPFLGSQPPSPPRPCHLLAVLWPRNEPSLTPGSPPRCSPPWNKGKVAPRVCLLQLRAGLSHQAGTCCSNGPKGPIPGNRTTSKKDGGARVPIPSSPQGCPRPTRGLLCKSAFIPTGSGRRGWLTSQAGVLGCVVWQPAEAIPEDLARRQWPPQAHGHRNLPQGTQLQPRPPEPTPRNPEREERRALRWPLSSANPGPGSGLFEDKPDILESAWAWASSGQSGREVLWVGHSLRGL